MEKYKKKKIPQHLRVETWLKVNGETFSVKCPVKWCTSKITVFSHECGHIIPESKGGMTTSDNLMPICGECNRGMGNRLTIDEWSDKFVAKSVPRRTWSKWISSNYRYVSIYFCPRSLQLGRCFPSGRAK
jgi:5-methylcytosine-specific restriction endonuclease McrA